MNRLTQVALHAAIIAFAAATLLPFAFVLNNSFRTNSEIFHSFFGLPRSLESAAQLALPALTDPTRPAPVENAEGVVHQGTAREALLAHLAIATRGYRYAWESIRPYMLNTFIVCGLTVAGVLFFGSVTAYILSRYRFPGSKGLFYYIISTMMFPAVLTLVPSFMLVRELGLLNSYWAMVLPYIAGGQVFAIFVFKSFFDGLPEELFESARLDGAGHFQCYRHIVIPLSKPILSVVAVMTTLGTWNNFLWPFITNTEGKYHVLASGLYVMATSQFGQNYSTLFAAYMLSSIPLLLLFVYATKPFIQGVTSGAFKA
ncbi:MAG: carbohydrate ABC transporter permease [FCB group bacterium]|jgi:ABC-type glycerol-3-phosphate transport system permease component|nr:carbohydrate ABC transporter permease [FCB group bacterium]